MSEFLAWANAILFGGLGAAVLAGWQIPRDPDCFGRCPLDTMSQMQDRIGDGPLALILFGCGFFGYFWYMLRR